MGHRNDRTSGFTPIYAVVVPEPKIMYGAPPPDKQRALDWITSDSAHAAMRDALGLLDAEGANRCLRAIEVWVRCWWLANHCPSRLMQRRWVKLSNGQTKIELVEEVE